MKKVLGNDFSVLIIRQEDMEFRAVELLRPTKNKMRYVRFIVQGATKNPLLLIDISQHQPQLLAALGLPLAESLYVEI